MGLTFANYVLQPFFDDCDVPTAATQLIAAVTICKPIHCYAHKRNIFICACMAYFSLQVS